MESNFDFKGKDTVLILSNDKNLGRKMTKSSTEEAVECLSSTIKSCRTSNNFKDADGVVFCKNPATEDLTNDNTERKDLKISVKIFLRKSNPESIKTATQYILKELQVKHLDMLILSPPVDVLKESDERETKLKLKDLEVYWNVLEQLHNDGSTLTIGCSDLDSNLLEALHKWAQVKPTVNHINLASCCVTPPEMVAFAKENGIQLLTHNDSRDILPAEANHSILSQLEPELPDFDKWDTDWIVRYHVLARHRGVVKSKGFILSAAKH